MNGLRSEWIAKWLDDIGLPQYKDQFYEARIDGRMLNQLTVVSYLLMHHRLLTLMRDTCDEINLLHY